jgi:hypothetical protein
MLFREHLWRPINHGRLEHGRQATDSLHDGREPYGLHATAWCTAQQHLCMGPATITRGLASNGLPQVRVNVAVLMNGCQCRSVVLQFCPKGQACMIIMGTTKRTHIGAGLAEQDKLLPAQWQGAPGSQTSRCNDRYRALWRSPCRWGPAATRKMHATMTLHTHEQCCTCTKSVGM